MNIKKKKLRKNFFQFYDISFLKSNPIFVISSDKHCGVIIVSTLNILFHNKPFHIYFINSRILWPNISTRNLNPPRKYDEKDVNTITAEIINKATLRIFLLNTCRFPCLLKAEQSKGVKAPKWSK